ncbi:hypothetical protein CAP47_07265 [Psychroflexus sp. S27]|nr:hypothetical protein CAP47_07265 [Psychroflexus sp. S27]
MSENNKYLKIFFLINFLMFFSINQAQETSKIDSLKSLVQNTTVATLKVNYQMKLARQIHRESHNDTLEIAYAEDAVDLALKINDTLLYAKALDNLGLLKRYHQLYNQALNLHIKAFNLIENKDVEPLEKMIFANNAGVAARYNQKYDISILYYMKALKIAEAENDKKNIGIACNGIGNALSGLPGREDESLSYFERALKTQLELGNTLGAAMNYLSIADYYVDKKDYVTARQYLQKLLKLNQDRNDIFGLAITYEYFGTSYLKEAKNYDKAISYYEKSFDLFKELKNKRKVAGLLYRIGQVNYNKKNYNKAEDYFSESLEISQQINQLGLIIANTFKISQLLEKKGDYKKALEFYKISETYEDSIKIEDQNIKIEALTRQYNLEKKESHIQLLEKDKALQKAVVEQQKEQLERRRIVTILLSIGLIFILIIFALQYRNYRTKKKTSERISKEEKEKMNAIYERNIAQAEILVTRLRVNPHFLFNSLNAITYLIQSEQNAKAIKYLKIFSRYTRMVLETSKHHVIPLQEELKLAQYYMMLEENRFEKDFIFNITGEDSPEIENVFIPPLLLQPFLENAIWHGLLLSENPEKKLSIHIVINQHKAQIIIKDNGVGRDKNKNRKRKKPHKSMGMQIIKERIELYNKSNPGKISLKIIDKKDEDGNALGTEIHINLNQN